MRSVVALLLMFGMGCQNGAVISDFSVGYAQRVTSGGADTRGGTAGWRFGVGTTKSPFMLDVHLLRVRVGDVSSRITVLGFGVMPYVRLGEVVILRSALGARLIDGGTRPRGGFGMFSPYADAGITFRISGGWGVSVLGGAEYETRFVGPRNGLIAQATLALTFAEFNDASPEDHGPDNPPPQF